MTKLIAASTEKVSVLRASGFASGVNGTYHDTTNGSWTKTDGSFYITTVRYSWRLRGAEGGDPLYAARRRDGQQCDGSTVSVLGTCRLYQWVEHSIARWSTEVEVAGAVEAGTENKRVTTSEPQALAMRL